MFGFVVGGFGIYEKGVFLIEGEWIVYVGFEVGLLVFVV